MKSRTKAGRSNGRGVPEPEVKPLAASTGSETNSPPQAPDPERIRRRAYEIFEARAGAPGDPDSDWVQAERELAGADGHAAPPARPATPAPEINARPHADAPLRGRG